MFLLTVDFFYLVVIMSIVILSLESLMGVFLAKLEVLHVALFHILLAAQKYRSATILHCLSTSNLGSWNTS